jgi:RNA-directed DNA polymerase
MLERATTVTREGAYTRVDYARYADDLVILVDWHRRHDWLLRAVHRLSASAFLNSTRTSAHASAL